MSDEVIRLPEAAVPRERGPILGHVCEHEGCAKHAGFGFARPRQDPHWFCFEHRGEGDRYL
ncbi:hypothetical protein FJ973_06130 [Mesorhizobium sp. B2-1-3]|uniref:hypothetical protein n=1 Tax=Mesorhizobium sp. B2-1-3 TaxID=2589972 RepID=UPI00112923AF|nr:hypothetical protein [Mesorhizobium sp. B2-1-3]TPN16268.1 hypothetical protein FJ973_06130 [Mesorhizobium sp. B2-1-3]